MISLTKTSKLLFLPLLVGSLTMPMMAYAQGGGAADKTEDVSPRHYSLTFEECAYVDKNLKYAPPSLQGPIADEAAILGTIASAFISKGIDALGTALSKAAAKKTYSVTAHYNVINPKDLDGGCLVLSRAGYHEFKIAMKRSEDFSVISPSLREFTYKRSITGSSSERGVAIQLAIKPVAADEAITRTVSLGELDPKKDAPIEETSIVMPLIPSPFVEIDKATSNLKAGKPFTISVTLTEVREANELLTFLSGVEEEVDDKAKELLIKVVGADSEDEDQDN